MIVIYILIWFWFICTCFDVVSFQILGVNLFSFIMNETLIKIGSFVPWHDDLSLHISRVIHVSLGERSIWVRYPKFIPLFPFIIL